VGLIDEFWGKKKKKNPMVKNYNGLKKLMQTYRYVYVAVVIPLDHYLL
jgi:hypothetical protein